MPDQATADVPPKDQGLPSSLIAPKGPLYQASVGPLDGASPDLSVPTSPGGQDTVTKSKSGFSSGTNKPILTTWQSTADWWASNSEAPRHVAEGIADVVNGESGFQVNNITQDTGGPSGGLYQAHLDRLTNLQSQQGWDLDPNIQHKWALQQLYGGDPIATAHRNEIFSAKTREEARELFSRYFERPAGTELANTQAGDLSSFKEKQSSERGLIAQEQDRLNKLVGSFASSKADSQDRRKLLQEALDRSHALQERMLSQANNPPTQKPTDLMSTFGSLAMLIGAIGGLKSRQPATAALQAAAGVIEGVQTNNHEEYERNFKTWQTQSKLLSELTGIQANDFRSIMENERLDEAERHNQIQEKFEEYGMYDSLTKMQMGQIEEAYKAPFDIMRLHNEMDLKRAQVAEAHAKTLAELAKSLTTAAGGKLTPMVDNGNKDAQGNPKPYFTDAAGNSFLVETQIGEDGQSHQTRTPYNPTSPSKIGGGGTSGGTLPPETLSRMAKQYVSTGDRSILTGLGYGSAGAANRAALQTEITKEMQAAGVPPEEMGVRIAEFQGIVAGERTLGTRTANIGMAVSSAEQLLPLAERASEETPRTQYPTLNDWMLAAEKQMGDTAPIKLRVAVNSFLNAYSRAVAPTGVPTDDVRKHAYELLSQAYNKGQFTAALEQMSLEMHAEQQAPGVVRGEFRKALIARVEKDHPEAAPASPPSGSQGKNLDVTKEQYDKLPSGATYTVPGDSAVRRKP